MRELSRSDPRSTGWQSRIALFLLFTFGGTWMTAQPDRELRAQRAAKLDELRPLAQRRLAAMIAGVDRDGDTTAREETAETTREGALFRYRQLHHGVYVENARVTIEVFNGRVSAVGKFKPDLTVNVVANLSLADAERIVRERLRPKGRSTSKRS